MVLFAGNRNEIGVVRDLGADKHEFSTNLGATYKK
jgi:hypothetical protein